MLVHRKQGRWCTFLCIHVHAKLGSASERTEGQAKQLLNTFSSFQSSVKIYWMEKTMKICTTAFDISEMKILKNWKYASNSLGGWCRVDLHLHENHILTAVLWVWPADFCSSVAQASRFKLGHILFLVIPGHGDSGMRENWGSGYIQYSSQNVKFNFDMQWYRIITSWTHWVSPGITTEINKMAFWLPGDRRGKQKNIGQRTFLCYCGVAAIPNLHLGGKEGTVPYRSSWKTGHREKPLKNAAWLSFPLRITF